MKKKGNTAWKEMAMKSQIYSSPRLSGMKVIEEKADIGETQGRWGPQRGARSHFEKEVGPR